MTQKTKALQVCNKMTCKGLNGSESGGARTLDPRLKRPLLYQLSYRFILFCKDFKYKKSHERFQEKIFLSKLYCIYNSL